jgi:hypothetical protein
MLTAQQTRSESETMNSSCSMRRFSNSESISTLPDLRLYGVLSALLNGDPFTQPYIANDSRYLSHGSHDIENEKYGNRHPLSLHPIILPAGAAKKGNGFFLIGIIGETLKWRLHPLFKLLPEHNLTQDHAFYRQDPHYETRSRLQTPGSGLD